jgi:hypothetical protein
LNRGRINKQHARATDSHAKRLESYFLRAFWDYTTPLIPDITENCVLASFFVAEIARAMPFGLAL